MTILKHPELPTLETGEVINREQAGNLIGIANDSLLGNASSLEASELEALVGKLEALLKSAKSNYKQMAKYESDVAKYQTAVAKAEEKAKADEQAKLQAEADAEAKRINGLSQAELMAEILTTDKTDSKFSKLLNILKGGK